MKSTKSGVPFSCVRWRPENANFKTTNIFTTVNADGEIQTWHLTSGKCLSTMKDDSKTSTDKQLYCVDYSSDGSKIAVCGSEPIVQQMSRRSGCTTSSRGSKIWIWVGKSTSPSRGTR